MSFKSIAALFYACLFSSVTIAAADCKNIEQLRTNAISSTDRIAAFAGKANGPVNAEDLNEFDFVVKTYSLKDNGELSIITGSLTAGSTAYKTVYAFNQYKTVGGKRYGVSIRMHIDFIAKSASSSISNLFGLLGVKGSTDKIDGTISMFVHGMKNPKAAFILPVPSRIDDSSAAQFLNYMSILKTLISESNSVDPVELSDCI